MGGNPENLFQALSDMERMEKKVFNLSLIFAEMLKDEINANDELRLYNGVKRIIARYSGDRHVISVVDEFTGVLTGGASLEEVMHVALEEAENPTSATGLMNDVGHTKH